MGRDEVRRYLRESAELGVKEYYFTGGEPFLHPEIVGILSDALAYGPVTVLTNGTVMTERLVASLREIAIESIYSLEFRVSIDHFDEARNDAIRGQGAYRKALRGMSRLATGGFLPIVTAMRTWEPDRDLEVIEAFAVVLRSAGVDRPRVKLLPSLKIVAEAARSGAYDPSDRVTAAMLRDFPVEQLLCSHSRIVTDRGVHVCPILIEEPDSRLGGSLGEGRRPYALRHGACTTCFLHGAFCANPGASVKETQVRQRSRMPTGG